MNALTHPADERRIREIVREELDVSPRRALDHNGRAGTDQQGVGCVLAVDRHDKRRGGSAFCSFANRLRDLARRIFGEGDRQARVVHRVVDNRHNSSPLSVGSTPTLGEMAAPDDVLRASSGAAIPYDGTVVEFIANEHSAVRVARDTRGGICLSAYGVSDPRLSSDEMFAQLNHCELMQFTKLLANILGCDLVLPL